LYIVRIVGKLNFFISYMTNIVLCEIGGVIFIDTTVSKTDDATHSHDSTNNVTKQPY